jgi:mannose-6-phosphate isomerase-like protein (cupin superfamily)
MQHTSRVILALMIAGGAVIFAQTQASSPVQHLAGDTVQAAFAKGGTLIETDAYKVMASRRDADGQAEVHARDTDIFYILEGTATLVTGGTVVNGKKTAADEERGDSIKGGQEQAVAKGDIITIQRGVPHLFKNVKAPFLYYTVKVTAPRP